MHMHVQKKKRKKKEENKEMKEKQERDSRESNKKNVEHIWITRFKYATDVVPTSVLLWIFAFICMRVSRAYTCLFIP